MKIKPDTLARYGFPPIEGMEHGYFTVLEDALPAEIEPVLLAAMVNRGDVNAFSLHYITEEVYDGMENFGPSAYHLQVAFNADTGLAATLYVGPEVPEWGPEMPNIIAWYPCADAEDAVEKWHNEFVEEVDYEAIDRLLLENSAKK